MPMNQNTCTMTVGIYTVQKLLVNIPCAINNWYVVRCLIIWVTYLKLDSLYVYRLCKDIVENFKKFQKSLKCCSFINNDDNELKLGVCYSLEGQQVCQISSNLNMGREKVSEKHVHVFLNSS